MIDFSDLASFNFSMPTVPQLLHTLENKTNIPFATFVKMIWWQS